MSKSIIRLEDVCFSYESEMVLKHLSADLAEQQIHFVMGNNGSGKTTLLKTMMGFLQPQRGRVLFNGADISSVDKRTMSRIVSYVPQAIYLNSDFSVIEYLSLGRTPYLGFSSKLSEEDYQIIEKYSVKLGVDLIYGMPFNKLSGGQKQMVAITRSLVQDTPLIIMDEPMSALDIGRQVELLKRLRELVESNKTIIMTTHNPNHAIATESNACFLKNGEIVAYGKSSDIIQEDLLHDIYGANVALEHGVRTDAVVFDMS